MKLLYADFLQCEQILPCIIKNKNHILQVTLMLNTQLCAPVNWIAEETHRLSS